MVGYVTNKKRLYNADNGKKKIAMMLKPVYNQETLMIF
jgi:hypothetical protein